MLCLVVLSLRQLPRLAVKRVGIAVYNFHAFLKSNLLFESRKGLL